MAEPTSLALVPLSHRPSADPPTLPLDAVLRLPALRGTVVLAGAVPTARPVAGAHVLQARTGLQFSRLDDLVLIAEPALDALAESPSALVAQLQAVGVVAVLVRPERDGSDLGALVAAARAARLPLLSLPGDRSLDDVLAAVLEHLVASRSLALQVAAQTRERVTELALSGAAVGQQLDELAEIVDGPVALLSSGGSVLAATPAEPEPRILDMSRSWLANGQHVPSVSTAAPLVLIWPVRVGLDEIGCLAARVAGERDPATRAGLEHAASTIAIELLHQRQAEQSAQQRDERFVRDLLLSALPGDVAERRAHSLGWSEQGPYRVAVIRCDADEERVKQALAPRAGRLITALDRGEVAAVLADGAAPAELGGLGIAGLSRAHARLVELPAALAEARTAEQAARRFAAGGRLRRFDELGALRPLVALPSAQLRAFADGLLGPVDRASAQRRAVLTETLRLLLEHDLNVAATARAGRWHYNTVRYRLTSLRELLGDFVEGGMHRQALFLALRVRDGLGPAER